MKLQFWLIRIKAYQHQQYIIFHLHNGIASFGILHIARLKCIIFQEPGDHTLKPSGAAML